MAGRQETWALPSLLWASVSLPLNEEKGEPSQTSH